MENLWKHVWQNKGSDYCVTDNGDIFTNYMELKRIDGFDVNVEDSENYYRNFFDSFCRLWGQLCNREKPGSAFEVGCGSGANLYLLKNLFGVSVGGLDYSERLIQIASKLVDSGDIFVGEADQMPTNPVYDVILSDSVFAYFESIDYAKRVLERMYDKAAKAILICEIFDKEKEQECIQYRRNMVEDYDERYRGLDKLFFSREIFIEFAKTHDCEIEFTELDNSYYWNSRYLYNCIMYKNN